MLTGDSFVRAGHSSADGSSAGSGTTARPPNSLGSDRRPQRPPSSVRTVPEPDQVERQHHSANNSHTDDPCGAQPSVQQIADPAVDKRPADEISDRPPGRVLLAAVEGTQLLRLLLGR